MTLSRRTIQASTEVREDLNKTQIHQKRACTAFEKNHITLHLLNLSDNEEEEEEEDLSHLHPGALLYRSAALQNFPVMADALAHGADVNWVNVNDESSTPLIQAVSVVRRTLSRSLEFESLRVL